MAIIIATATYPDNKQIDLRDTFCTAFGYQDMISDGQGGQIANPQSKAQFIQQKVDEHFKTWLRNVYKAEKDRQTAISTAITNNLEIS